MTDPIQIFCGADRNEMVPLAVLTHSLRRHSKRPIEVAVVDNHGTPDISDPRFWPYTRFSFGRFAIPKRMGFEGRAIYLDSDMVALADIDEIDATPFGEAKILIEQGGQSKKEKGKHAAVMALDCAALTWQQDEIVRGLGKDYSYNELMAITPLLNNGDMAERIPTGWNELDEVVDGQTRLIHYTRIDTQPWITPGHPFGHVWLDEVKRMLRDQKMTESTLHEDVELGYLRPSLLLELGIGDKPSVTDVEALKAHDAQQGFIPHKELFDRFDERKIAIINHEADEACQQSPWLTPWIRFKAQMRVKKYRKRQASRA